ncbi:MAG: hypothetical protein JSU81_09305 [Candidatus Coatesbacteria bacterium]|nr:MAG: hypothetical protein JSU81_09305 [Candidatus Coatesbacteria bacterium]
MKVELDGAARDVRTGSPVKTLLSEAERRAVAAGKAVVVDAWGQRLGLEGALTKGGAYFLVRLGERPPAVNASLEAWEAREDRPALPPAWVKFLVREAGATLAKAGGASSPAGTAAFAAAAAVRGDGETLWRYLAGEGREAYVFGGGKARLRDFAPGVEAVVVATRDVLTFRSGATTFDFLEGIAVVEVGTTNRVTAADYEARFGDVQAVVACAAGDFAMEGFVAAPDRAELAAAAAAAGLLFASLEADGRLLEEGGASRRWPGDVVVAATPPEARPYDIVIAAGPSPGVSPGDPALRAGAAEAIWRYAKGEL